jgi:hypothetical protein
MQWQLKGTADHWEAIEGNWRAVVVRLSGSSDWYAYIERVRAPQDRRDGPDSQWAMDGRMWCEAEIARLESSADA